MHSHVLSSFFIPIRVVENLLSFCETQFNFRLFPQTATYTKEETLERYQISWSILAFELYV